MPSSAGASGSTPVTPDTWGISQDLCSKCSSRRESWPKTPSPRGGVWSLRKTMLRKRIGPGSAKFGLPQGRGISSRKRASPGSIEPGQAGGPGGNRTSALLRSVPLRFRSPLTRVPRCRGTAWRAESNRRPFKTARNEILIWPQTCSLDAETPLERSSPTAWESQPEAETMPLTAWTRANAEASPEDRLSCALLAKPGCRRFPSPANDDRDWKVVDADGQARKGAERPEGLAERVRLLGLAGNRGWGRLPG